MDHGAEWYHICYEAKAKSCVSRGPDIALGAGRCHSVGSCGEEAQRRSGGGAGGRGATHKQCLVLSGGLRVPGAAFDVKRKAVSSTRALRSAFSWTLYAHALSGARWCGVLACGAILALVLRQPRDWVSRRLRLRLRRVS
eukprot:1460908-Rhodomonas_salina.4